jgi:large subunit ribosomal protein L24
MRRKNNNIPKLHIKKGDQVRVLSGKDRGHSGRVLSVNPRQRTAIVEDVNKVTKHVKPNQQNPNGERMETEAPMHVSKLQLLDPKTGEPTRIGRRYRDTQWVRYSKKTGEDID